MRGPYFLGIDIGTQGARVVLLDVAGHVVGSQEEAFALNEKSREEQSPQEWWAATQRSVKALLKEADGQITLASIKAISVTSTSGTVIPLDAAHYPLHPAIMYSDNRSAEQGRLCKQVAQQYHPQGYTGFNASSGLSKMVWFGQQYPDKAQRLHKWIHATDFIIGKLSENWGITDYTNALKSGYDVNEGYWPAYIYEQLPLKKEWLPEVVPSGTPIGHLAPALAAGWGLSPQVQIVAGMTDGCASQIASGAVNLGDWNTTIGTTLVVKGVTRTEIKDPADRLYSHRHPKGFWMPGGASNTGADWITREFKADLDELNEQAAQLMPSGYMAYPLRQEGERFPFISPQARGFEPTGLTPAQRFVANLEGVAYLERYAFELIERLSGEKVKAVYTAGGASNSDTWLTIRSNVLNRPIYKMRHVTGAVGAAILAASKTHFNSIIEATQALTHIEKEFQPNPALSTSYEAGYQEFIRTLQEKGYIQKDYQYA
ncbi:FGGY-family carbohydrate kinase [Adhaeribacter rhizoryzae]|uniref:FGGY-family carbohydrate kinase n=1 Tax=Adhaeribacter rhizoryzae TaxID=2607907 RepID=A0A5M6DMK4_9BACT|nr:FGGY-family carbohydrate kinase [Adhaeribacter rhizoryzae]KAA5547492.1 FGGY-family carbohydrate kinase [Adhaeribacter rhizoryzae]